jgi:hypothetical protein
MHWTGELCIEELSLGTDVFLLAAAPGGRSPLLTHTSRPQEARGVGDAHSVTNRAVTSPRKICRAERSRASLRRELAHPQDTNTPAHERRPLPDAGSSIGFAASFGADGHHWSSLLDQARSRTRQARQARPDRPPSRPRSRPRATGTSEPGVPPAEGAARAPACSMNRTCVRTVGRLPDRTDTNTCTHRFEVPCLAKYGLPMRVAGCQRLQRELQILALLGGT